MKLRRLPEDFVVEEVTRFRATGGPFAFYRLEKRSLGTPEAIDAICDAFRVPRWRVGYGGLKDRHACTTQYLTIEHGPKRPLRQEHFSLTFLGQAPRAYNSPDIEANRFSIVLRGLTDEESAGIAAAVEPAARDGLPNFFDDQRFGSRTTAGEFMARPWCLGDYERALWLVLVEANPHDRPADRERKELLRQYWGQWRTCIDLLPRSTARTVATFLVDNPTDFRRAIAYLPVHERSLYLSAYQSYLWNKALALFLRGRLPADALREIPVERGTLPFFLQLDPAQRAELQALDLALPAARAEVRPGWEEELLQQVLVSEQIERRQLRVKYPRDSFFSKGRRPVIVTPQNLEHFAAADELQPTRRRATLRFALPRGSYATILVKRLTLGAVPEEAEAPEME